MAGAIEIRLRELNQLFDSLDPSPFHEKDLDRNAERYIVESVKELPGRRAAGLAILLDQPLADAAAESAAGEAIRAYFGRQAERLHRELRRLLRRGAVSLAIGLTFLVVAMLTGQAVVGFWGEKNWTRLVRESLLIGGWVAMWRPLEIFLYDWWPIVGEFRIYQRLSAVEVRVSAAGGQTVQSS